jgi:hypothetical protein
MSLSPLLWNVHMRVNSLRFGDHVYLKLLQFFFRDFVYSW